MFKIVFLDIDGTLLKSDHTISAPTIEIIQRLKKEHVPVVLVSARPLHGITRIAETTGLLDLPIASLNGALIAIQGKVIFELPIDIDLTPPLHEYLKQYHVTPIFYNHHRWFSGINNQHTIYEQQITDVPITIEPFMDTFQHWQKLGKGPDKILAIGDAFKIKELENDLIPQFGRHLNIYPSKPTYLEIMNREASKLNAVKYVLAKYHFKQEETIAIGDNYNDMEMIAFAGMGVAMGNSPDEVKTAADYITDTNNQDGVFKAIKYLMNL